MLHDNEITPVDSIKTVLVVEDDVEIGYFLAQALKEEASYKVIFATDASQALRMIRLVRPNLFLLDYYLPGMTGLELIEQVRAINEFAETPIILMSANLPKQGINRTDITTLHKPFELDAFLQYVKDCLEK